MSEILDNFSKNDLMCDGEKNAVIK